MSEALIKPTDADHNCGLLIAEAVNGKLAERKSPHWVEASAEGLIVQTIARHSVAVTGELVGALHKLLATAVLLLNNSEGCAMNHYGEDWRGVMPGWLEDCRNDILAATLELEKHGAFTATPNPKGAGRG